MRSRALHDFRFPFTKSVPRDYLARRKMYRKISGVVMIALLSLLVAGVLVYYADPQLSFLR